MRDIRFRLWDKLIKRMIVTQKLDSVRPMLDFFGNVGIMNINDDCKWNGIVPRNQYELMQYTGLTDDEEKEIYEGDVIQLTWECDSCWGKAGTYKGYVRFGKGIFEVVYIGREKITKYADGGWHENSESDDISSLMSWSEDIEVIGNIYENPELLEGQK